MIAVEAAFEVPAPIASVYASLCDVGEIGYVIAGVKDVEVLSDTESNWKVEVRAGIVAQTLKLAGRIVERVPPHRLSFVAEGRNVSLSGVIDLTALGEAETGFGIRIQSDVTGRLAPIVELISRTTQKQLIEQTIANFRAKIATGASVPAEDIISAAASGAA